MATTTKSRPAKTASASTHIQLPDAYHQLHSLLDTIRTLAAHEDDICTLLAAIMSTGTLDGGMRRDLTKLLGSLPTECLKQELDALQFILQRRAT